MSGVQMAVSMSNTGGAWDNAKKYVEVGDKQTPSRFCGQYPFCVCLANIPMGTRGPGADHLRTSVLKALLAAQRKE